jgi:hypothetical protein
MTIPEQDQLNIWDLQPGDWLYDGSPSAVCWGRVTDIKTNRLGSTERVLLEWFMRDPRVEPPITDYIHRASADHALNKIHALLRPMRLPVTQMNLLAILNVLPHHPQKLPVNPVMLVASGFAVVYYNLK